MRIVIALVTAMLLLPQAQSAAGPCSARRTVAVSHASIVVSNGLTVVPFAVPVAVPVASVNRPTLFYGYSGYAPPQANVSTAQEPSAVNATEVNDAARQPDTNEPKAVDILSRNCSACHTGAASHGGLQIFHGTGQMFDRLPRHVILEMVSPDAEGVQKMPPGDRSKLSPEDIEIIREWARLPRNAVY